MKSTIKDTSLEYNAWIKTREIRVKASEKAQQIRKKYVDAADEVDRLRDKEQSAFEAYIAKQRGK